MKTILLPFYLTIVLLSGSLTGTAQVTYDFNTVPTVLGPQQTEAVNFFEVDSYYYIDGSYESYQHFFMKMDTLGQLVDYRLYGGVNYGLLSNDYGNTILVGDRFVRSECMRDSLNNRYGLLMVLDLNLDTLWTRKYSNPCIGPNDTTVSKNCWFTDIERTPEGGYLITGYAKNPQNTQEVFFLKVAANGDQQWCKQYPSTSFAFSTCLTPDLGIMTLLYSNIDDVIKTNALGVEQWRKRFTYGMRYGVRGDMLHIGDSCLLFTQKYIMDTTDLYSPVNLRLVKLNYFTGQVVWLKDYTVGNEVDHYYRDRLHALPDGTISVCGTTRDYLDSASSYVYGDIGYNLIVDKDGNELGLYYYSHMVLDKPQHMINLIPTSDGGFLGGGKFWDTEINPWIFKVKAIPTGIGEERKADIDLRVFPNPCSHQAIIDMDIHGKAQLILSDLNGKHLKSLQVEPGEKRVKINMSEFEEGIYFLQLTTEEGRSTTRKLMRVR